MAIDEQNSSWGTGEDNSLAKMTNAEAEAARSLRAEFRMTVQDLATMYGVTRCSMSLLLRGRTYREAGGPLDPGRRTPSREPGSRSKEYRMQVEAEAQAARDDCEHHFIAEHRPGHLIYWVRQCSLCHNVDWADLDQQIREFIQTLTVNEPKT